jgi:hypothetical protein
LAVSHAVVWKPDGAVPDLNTLIDPSNGWVLNEAWGISDTNWVSGYGSFDPDGGGPLKAYTRAFLLNLNLNSIPEPTSLSVLAFAASIFQCRRRR